MQPFEIIDDVCRLHGITRDELRAENKGAQMTAIRVECMRMLRAIGLNYAQIGRMVGRARVTVYYHIKGRNR